MGYNKIYDSSRNTAPTDQPVDIDLPPLDLTEATPVLLASLVAKARLPDADPKIIAQALDALLKRDYGEADKARSHDIRQVMGVMCEGCLNKLEAACKP
jgi:hypothetical protein